MTRDRITLLIAAAVLLGCLAGIAALPSPHTQIPVFLGLFGGAFAAYLVAMRRVLRAAAAPLMILIVCAAAHAMLVPARPDLSTDIYRYAWEGRVVLDGHDPFALAPNDTTLAYLRDADYPLVSHHHMPTIYPPLAQGVFALATLIHPGPAVLKVLFSLFNLGTVLVLMRILRRAGRPPAHALVFAWNPLVIVETAHSGHLDAMAVFMLVLAIDLWQSKRRALAALALGASALVKYLALAMVPWLARRRRLIVLAIVALVVVIGYLPFAGAGPRLFSSLRAYSENWFFNGPPFMAFSAIIGDAAVTRRLLAAGVLAFSIAAAFRESDIARYTFLVVGCVLVVSPTVYPWYLMWIIPLLCLFPNPAWIGFSGLVMLSYSVWMVYGETGAWLVPTWVLAIEYIPFYLMLLVGLARSDRTAKVPA